VACAPCEILALSRERCKQSIDGGVVAKRFADVREAVDVAGPEDKAPSKLKWVLSRFVLAMAGCPSARSGGGIVAAKQMQQVGGFQSCGSIGQPLLVDQQRKRDPRFLAEEPRVLAVPQSDGSQTGSLFLERFLVLAQLRDVFTAENSAVVPQKNEHCGPARPQRPENYFPSIAIRKSDRRQLGAKGLFHGVSILATASLCCQAAWSTAFVNRFRMLAKAIILNGLRPCACTIGAFGSDGSHFLPMGRPLASRGWGACVLQRWCVRCESER